MLPPALPAIVVSPAWFVLRLNDGMKMVAASKKQHSRWAALICYPNGAVGGRVLDLCLKRTRETCSCISQTLWSSSQRRLSIVPADIVTEVKDPPNRS